MSIGGIPHAGEPGAGHPGFLRELDAMRELHCRKAADYGRGADPFANVRASAEFGIPAWVGVMVRAGDKLHRIKSFIQNGSLKNESVEDSLRDLAAYAIIALVLYREQYQPETPGEVSAAGDRPPPPAELRRRVYIAGPISKGDLQHNLNQATAAFVALAQADIAPFCPHWSVYSKPANRVGNGGVRCGMVWCEATIGGNDEMTHADWIGIDLPWVAAADAVLRLPGESSGADKEVKLAGELGIPVFHSADEVIRWSQTHARSS